MFIGAHPQAVMVAVGRVGGTESGKKGEGMEDNLMCQTSGYWGLQGEI